MRTGPPHVRTGRHALAPALAAAHGVDVLEAPVTGGVHKAAAGEITVLAGGDDSVLATGDAFIADAATRDALAQRADLVDMEGFAIAFAAQAAGATCRLVKHVSDHADDSALDWPAMIDASARELGRWLNNRAENSHLPFRRRERAMLRFRRMRTLQKFASIHASVHNHFPTERHLLNRDHFKQSRAAALAEWRGLLAA